MEYGTSSDLSDFFDCLFANICKNYISIAQFWTKVQLLFNNGIFHMMDDYEIIQIYPFCAFKWQSFNLIRSRYLLWCQKFNEFDEKFEQNSSKISNF